MPTILTRTIGSGKDYATFTAAEAATPTIGTSADLVANDEAIVFEADAGTYNGTFTIDGGLTCDATRNVTYTFASGAYHGGTVGAGVVISGGSSVITVKEEHTNLVGLEVVGTATNSGSVIWVEGYGYNGSQLKDLLVWSGASLFDATGGIFSSIRQRNPIASYDPPTQLAIDNMVFNSTNFGIGVFTNAADVGNNVAIRNCTCVVGRFITDAGSASTPSGVTRNVEFHNNLDLDNVGVLFGAQASTGYTGTATNVARNSTWPSSLRAGSQLWTVTTDDTASSTGSQVIYSGTTAELYDVAGNDAWQYLTSLTNAPATSIDSVTRLGTGFNPGAYEADAGGGGGTPLPGKATTPVPADAATGIALDPTLQWSAGADTVDYDVYFGTDTLSLEQAGRTTPSWAKTGLLASTKYQWRIDSNNATGTTTGDVWEFTTLDAPGQVVSGTPADASTDRPITQDISWSATSGTTTYAVYFGTATSPPKVVNGQAGTTYDPGTLAYSTTYYWRVDSTGDGGTTTGVENTFTTEAAPVILPGQVTSGTPADSTVNVDRDQDLSWSPTSDTVSYDVYYGTSTPPSLVSSAQAGTTYDPGTMALSTVHYWRIDSVNGVGTTTGVEFSFATEAPSPPSAVTTGTPLDGATGVDVDQDISWSAASGAATYNVYFDTSANPQPVALGITNLSFDPGTLAYATTYYWRVDTVNVDGTTTGTLLSFTTADAPPAQVPSGTPTPGATAQALGTDLAWTAASGATSYNVYWGTDSSPDAGEFLGNTAGLTWALNPLSYSTTYYWRIDAVNSGGVTTGTVWSFSTIPNPDPGGAGIRGVDLRAPYLRDLDIRGERLRNV